MIVVALEVVEVSVGVPLLTRVHPSKSSSSSPSIGNDNENDYVCDDDEYVCDNDEHVCDDDDNDGCTVLHVMKLH